MHFALHCINQRFFIFISFFFIFLLASCLSKTLHKHRFYKKYIELRARIKANSCPVLPASPVSGVGIGVNNSANNYSVQRSSSLKDHRQLRYIKSNIFCKSILMTGRMGCGEKKKFIYESYTTRLLYIESQGVTALQ